MFITFEGVDASGKSTQVRKVSEALTKMGVPVIVTREPGGTPGAEDIRSLILEGDKDLWSPETEMLLFNAARRDHVEKVIRPSLEKGIVVICDRFVDTTYAYQGMRGEAALEMAKNLHEMMIDIEPDLTIMMEVDLEVANARIGLRPDENNRMEAKGIEFRAKAIEAYRNLASYRPAMVRIDGNGEIDDITAQILDVITSRLETENEPGHP